MLKKYITGLSLLITIFPAASNASIGHGKYHDYRAIRPSIELQKMQDFHLQQAQKKMHNHDLAHAWGDLAYLLCRVPNHHEALQQMLVLAPQLHKQTELQGFLTTAIQVFPEDPVLHMLYGTFLRDIGEHAAADKHLGLAQSLK